MPTVEAKGHNGTATFDGEFVTIKRSGFIAATTQGRGEKRISVRQITAVQFKPATSLFAGYIAFTIGGGSERHSRAGGQTGDAMRDENAVVFQKKSLAEFEALRDAVERAVASGGQQPVAAVSGADEVGRLAKLHAQGVLSDAEFAAAKAKALGI